MTFASIINNSFCGSSFSSVNMSHNSNISNTHKSPTTTTASMQINSLAQVKPFNKIAILHHTRNICFHSHRDKNNRNFQAMPYASINVSQDHS